MNRAGAKLRVLHVVDTLEVSGSQATLLYLIERTRPELSYSVCCVRHAGATASRFADLGVPLTALGKGPGREWQLWLPITRLCRRIRPDIVHTHNWGAVDGILGARLAGVPALVHTEHGNRGDLLAGGRRRRLGRRLASHLVDRIVVVSDELHRSMRSDLAVRAAKLHVIRNGVDAELFRPPPERDVLRRRLGFAADDLLVGTTGRLEEVKNQQLLIEAAARLVPKHPRLRVVLVGDGGRRAALEELRDRLGLERRVVFAGARDDVPAWLGVLDVFALPSHAEGTSVALLEAMAVGLPVVATRVGGSPDLVEDGACGRLTPPGDVDALAQALDGLLASPELRREYGTAARARACERHTVERTVAAYRTLYESLVLRSFGVAGEAPTSSPSTGRTEEG